MDFHAVVEAWVDGQWNVVDATCLAPRQANGAHRDGSGRGHTAFLTTTGGIVEPTDMEVTASTDGTLPSDDITAPTTLR